MRIQHGKKTLTVKKDSVPGCRTSAEIDRRADIVRRYVAIERPSSADDRLYAAELGLSHDSLFRLAAAWRRHGDPNSLQGARPRPGLNAVAAAITAAEGDIDLSKVSPARRAETRRRIRIIRDHLKIKNPSREDVDRSAALFGVQRYRFNRIVKTWILHRDPAAIPGAVTPARRTQRKKPRITQDTEQAIADAINELGVTATSLAIHARASALCRDRGCAPPAKSTVYYRLQTARSLYQDGADTIVIDHTALALAVRGPTGIQFPVLSFAVHMPSRRILAQSVSFAPPTAEVTATLIKEVVSLQTSGGKKVILALRAPVGNDWDRLIRDLEADDIVFEIGETRSLSAGRLASYAFGRRLGRLRFRPKLTATPTTTTLKIAGSAVPLDFDEAAAAIHDAIAEHNLGAQQSEYVLMRR